MKERETSWIFKKAKKKHREKASHTFGGSKTNRKSITKPVAKASNCLFRNNSKVLLDFVGKEIAIFLCISEQRKPTT